MSTEPARTILVVTDADDIFDEVDAAMGDERTSVKRLRAGRDVRAAVLTIDPDLVICDLQIGNMGGMATALDLRLEEGAGRIGPRPILLLLDREADTFVARRSGADAWVVKPLDALSVRRCAEALIGESRAS